MAFELMLRIVHGEALPSNSWCPAASMAFEGSLFNIGDGFASDRLAGERIEHRAADCVHDQIEIPAGSTRLNVLLAAAQRYFEKSIDQNGEPETITIDKSGSNLAALEALNAQRGTAIKIRQNKYLNNIIEQDHRAIKRRTRSMLGFKTFRCARILLGGIELMHMIKKGQITGSGQTAAEQFYSLAK